MLEVEKEQTKYVLHPKSWTLKIKLLGFSTVGLLFWALYQP